MNNIYQPYCLSSQLKSKSITDLPALCGLPSPSLPRSLLLSLPPATLALAVPWTCQAFFFAWNNILPQLLAAHFWLSQAFSLCPTPLLTAHHLHLTFFGFGCFWGIVFPFMRMQASGTQRALQAAAAFWVIEVECGWLFNCSKIQLFNRGTSDKVNEAAVWVDHLLSLPLAKMHSGIRTGDFMQMMACKWWPFLHILSMKSMGTVSLPDVTHRGILRGTQGMVISLEEQLYTVS